MSWSHRPWEMESRQRDRIEFERREFKRLEIEEELKHENCKCSSCQCREKKRKFSGNTLLVICVIFLIFTM
jgi:hypothetical protein